jgi:hypothetical protein
LVADPVYDVSSSIGIVQRLPDLAQLQRALTVSIAVT